MGFDFKSESAGFQGLSGNKQGPFSPQASLHQRRYPRQGVPVAQSRYMNTPPGMQIHIRARDTMLSQRQTITPNWFVSQIIAIERKTGIHLIDKTLSGANYKPWTMRQDGILGRQQWQACYSVPYIDIQDIFIAKKVLE